LSRYLKKNPPKKSPQKICREKIWSGHFLVGKKIGRILFFFAPPASRNIHAPYIGIDKQQIQVSLGSFSKYNFIFDAHILLHNSPSKWPVHERIKL